MFESHSTHWLQSMSSKWILGSLSCCHLLWSRVCPLVFPSRWRKYQLCIVSPPCEPLVDIWVQRLTQRDPTIPHSSSPPTRRDTQHSVSVTKSIDWWNKVLNIKVLNRKDIPYICFIGQGNIWLKLPKFTESRRHFKEENPQISFFKNSRS